MHCSKIGADPDSGSLEASIQRHAPVLCAFAPQGVPNRAEAKAARGACQDPAMRMVTLADGAPVPCLGLGTWRMGESRSSHAADVAAVRQALRTRLSADRHGRDVRRRRRRAGGRRSAARGLDGGHGPAGGRVPRHEGPAGQRQPQGDSRGVRAQPGAVGRGPRRPLPAPLARRPSAERDGGGVRGAARARPDPRLGRQQLRRRRHGRVVGRGRRAALRGEPGLLLGQRARHRVRPAARAAPAFRGDHGVLPDRPGRAGLGPDLRGDRRPAGRQRRAGRARVGPAAAGRRSRSPRPDASSTCARTSPPPRSH